jgi:hypothetical protein
MSSLSPSCTAIANRAIGGIGSNKNKSLAKGEVELKPRNGALQAIKAEAAVEAVMKLINL